MATIEYEVMAVTGEYTDREGQVKKRWQKCGVVMRTDKGLSLKLEVMPVGTFNGFFSLFEPRARDEQPQRQFKASAEFQDTRDDVPF